MASNFLFQPYEASVKVLRQCLEDVVNRLKVTKLKHNPEKMEVMLIGKVECLSGISLPDFPSALHFQK